MSSSSGKLAGKKKWLVARYPKPPGQLIVLGAILSDPEEPESILNRHQIAAINPDDIDNETVAVQRTIQADLSQEDSVLLKVAHPIVGAGLSMNGKLTRDTKTVVDALDVKAKIFLPKKAYMEESIKAPGVQEYIKNSYFTAPLYMIMGVASAMELSIDEEASRQHTGGAGATAPDPAGSGTASTGEVQHTSSAQAASGLKVKEECDFAYRIRRFRYWKCGVNMIQDGGDRTKGVLFGHGDGDDDFDDDDDDDTEKIAIFNDIDDDDVTGSETGLGSMET